MFLTQEEESKIIEEYSKKIWHCVYKFEKNPRSPYIEDLYQDAVIVFISFIRTCDSRESIHAYFPEKNIKNSLCRNVMSRQPVSFSKTRTTDFKKIVDSTKTVEFNDSISQTLYVDDFENYIVTRMTFESYLNTCSDLERNVLLLKIHAKKNCEIARELNVSNATVSRILHKIKRQLLQ